MFVADKLYTFTPLGYLLLKEDALLSGKLQNRKFKPCTVISILESEGGNFYELASFSEQDQCIDKLSLTKTQFNTYLNDLIKRGLWYFIDRTDIRYNRYVFIHE